MKKELFPIVVTMLVYSLIGFSYMHSTFTSKDMFGIILQDIREMKSDIKKLIGE
jgi:hypothetical protein